ncbi:hypothetical protein CW304_25185 [Bacillus sp. UFRGS-B20]|nr:hypothetical protein CW304_25185 [Bacillus sp. UFRGS-B20]
MLLQLKPHEDVEFLITSYCTIINAHRSMNALAFAPSFTCLSKAFFFLRISKSNNNQQFKIKIEISNMLWEGVIHRVKNKQILLSFSTKISLICRVPNSAKQSLKWKSEEGSRSCFHKNDM